MTVQQANWARQHDWYHSEQNSAGGIIIWVRDDMKANSMLSFRNFKELYIWAGY